MLKTKNKEKVINLISKKDDKQKIKIIKELADFNESKELLNFVLDFYDFDKKKTVFISGNIQHKIKIEDKLKLDFKNEQKKS